MTWWCRGGLWTLDAAPTRHGKRDEVMCPAACVQCQLTRFSIVMGSLRVLFPSRVVVSRFSNLVLVSHLLQGLGSEKNTIGANKKVFGK